MYNSTPSAVLTYLTGSCHFFNLQHVCSDSFHALRSPGVSGEEIKIYERSLQALLSSAPRSRVLARLTSLAQMAELARRLTQTFQSVNHERVELVLLLRCSWGSIEGCCILMLKCFYTCS